MDFPPYQFPLEMTCYHPINAHIAGINTSGKKLIKFGLPTKHDQEMFLLPCGQCIGCRLDRSIMWAARCMHESQMHDESQFITLTYENEPLDGSLNPPDFTKFMKRYRKYLEPTKIRYFHGAEYGDLLQRPHHHACIFGHDFKDKEIFHECEGIITYYSPTLEKIWGHGFCTTSELTLASAAYVARYCLKKVTTSKNSPEKYHAHYETISTDTGEIRLKQPEYATMSRAPGIANDWYQKFNSDIFPHDNCIVHGKQVKTPRYYENLLRSTDEPAYDILKSQRKESAQKHQGNNTTARLITREKLAILTLDQRKKLHET